MLKPNVVPSIFKCQEDKAAKYEKIERVSSIGRERKVIVQECLKATGNDRCPFILE